MRNKDLAEIASYQNELIADYNGGFYTYRELCTLIAETLSKEDEALILREIQRIEMLDEIRELRKALNERFDEILMENKEIENIITKF